jgi:ribosome maturation factor RimP
VVERAKARRAASVKDRTASLDLMRVRPEHRAGAGHLPPDRERGGVPVAAGSIGWDRSNGGNIADRRCQHRVVNRHDTLENSGQEATAMTGRNGGAPSSAGVEQALTELLAPVLAGQAVVVEDLRLVPAGKRKVLRILVDRDPYAGEQHPPEETIDGLSLDEVAQISRTVSTCLDALTEEQDPLAGTAYTLEVSSPGVDRALTLPRHFRRNVGRLVDLRTTAGASLRCRITAATPDSVTVQTGHGPRELGWSEIEAATVQVEFRRAAAEPAEPAEPAEDEQEG